MGPRLLRFGWPLRVLGALVAAFFPAIAADGVVTASADERVLPIALFVVALVSGALIVAFFFRAHWRVDENGIEQRLPLRKRVTLAWSEVTSVRANGSGLFVSGPLKPTFHFAGALRDLDVLAYFVLTRVDAACIASDATRRRLAYRARRHLPLPTHAFAPEPVEGTSDPRARWRENPFFVLGLSPECARADVERAGQKLLGLLAIGSASARTYATPVGDEERTADRVRAATAELRDPDRRVVHELWARAIDPTAKASDDANGAAAHGSATRPWDEAMRSIGARRG